MRSFQAALVLAALLCLTVPALAADPDPAELSAAAALPGPELKSGNATDDTPPPFVSRPKRPAQPPRQDFTYAKGPEPAGFRGLPWGTTLETARAQAGLVPVTEPKPLPGTFHRPDETLTLGDAVIRTVAYYFPKGRLIGVGIVFEGEANFFLVKDHLISQYGPGRQVGGRYGWTWNAVNIDMRLRDGVGELRYTYEPPSPAVQAPP
jgi:hypothetical protein